MYYLHCNAIKGTFNRQSPKSLRNNRNEQTDQQCYKKIRCNKTYNKLPNNIIFYLGWVPT